MKNILECRLMRMLLYGTRYDYESEKLLDAYKEFHDKISQITDSDMQQKKRRTRVLLFCTPSGRDIYPHKAGTEGGFSHMVCYRLRYFV